MSGSEGADTVSSLSAVALFYCLGLIVVGGGFVLYTAGADPRIAREVAAGSPLSQLLLGVFYVIGALLLLANHDMRQILRVAWPVLLLPALAFVSVFWSPEPQLTLRRAFAFTGTIVFGLSLGAAFRFRFTMTLVSIAIAVVMLISLVLAFLDPLRAVHQPDDVIQAVHAGYWRGIFAHRNTLGFWAGAGIVILFLAGGEAVRRGWLWGGAILCATASLFASGSSAGLAIVALGATFFVVLRTILSRPVHLRGGLAVFWLLVGLLALLCFEDIARFGLHILGRESNLSGRTELWSYLLDMIRDSDKPLGLGYFVGTLLLDQRLSAAMQIHNVNAHNGFLEAYVYFGWLGLVVAAGVAAWLLYEAVRFAAKSISNEGYLAILPAVMVFLCIVHNLVESTIVSPNNLNNVMLSLTASIVARSRLSEKLKSVLTSRTRLVSA